MSDFVHSVAISSLCSVSARTLLERAAFLTVIDSENIKAPFCHRADIGETLNCIVSTNKEMYYLPFWKLRVRSTGIEMDTFADFLRITNQPLVILAKHTKMELIFWVPAFKLRPSSFLRLGKNITLSQAKIPTGEETVVSVTEAAGVRK